MTQAAIRADLKGVCRPQNETVEWDLYSCVCALVYFPLPGRRVAVHLRNTQLVMPGVAAHRFEPHEELTFVSLFDRNDQRLRQRLRPDVGCWTVLESARNEGGPIVRADLFDIMTENPNRPANLQPLLMPESNRALVSMDCHPDSGFEVVQLFLEVLQVDWRFSKRFVPAHAVVDTPAPDEDFPVRQPAESDERPKTFRYWHKAFRTACISQAVRRGKNLDRHRGDSAGISFQHASNCLCRMNARTRMR